MRICMVIPFRYKWNSYPITRCSLETLGNQGHTVILRIKNTKNLYRYDQVWLMGAGTRITKERFREINIPVIAFGLSDPNLFHEDHLENCNIYFTNDLRTYNKYKHKKKVYWFPICCDKRYHKNLGLEKKTDILTYGIGRHPFVPYRNDMVNKLRTDGFKIKVFGREWDKHEDTHKFITGEQLIEEINKAKILLDITDEKTSLGHRLMEGSGCGTPVMTRKRHDTGHLFEFHKEILVYSNYEDLKKKLHHYLANPEKLTGVGRKAQAKCYKDHDIINRINKVLKYV